MANGFIDTHWQRITWLSCLLWPLSVLYQLWMKVRRGYHLKANHKNLDKPVIVVGNLTVGGTGKTPMVLYLLELLRNKGYRPGIVMRGYKANCSTTPFWVNPDSLVSIAGDEALLLARRGQVPVVIDPNRRRGGQFLLNQSECDIVISDDGLQHYRLARDIEICMIDGIRRFGNGFCLPAGPLREPIDRIEAVDMRVSRHRCEEGEWLMSFNALPLKAVKVSTSHWSGPKPPSKIHAIAGIGNPEQFFDMLRHIGYDCIKHNFADHHIFTEHDLCFDDEYPIIMTEKDAVKCAVFAKDHWWYLPIVAELPDGFAEQLFNLLEDK